MKRLSVRLDLLGVLLASWLTSGCVGPVLEDPGGQKIWAVAHVLPVDASGVRGDVFFYELPEDHMRVVADFQGLEPGLHGFHIHEFKDCSGPNALSAGGHWSEGEQQHGSNGQGVPVHLGDLGNIYADLMGNAHLDVVIARWKNTRALLGRSVIVHALADDLISQPSGASGRRIGCGAIDKFDHSAVLSAMSVESGFG